MKHLDTKLVRKEDVHGFVMLLLRTGWGMARDAERIIKDIEKAIDDDRPEGRAVIVDNQQNPPKILFVYDGPNAIKDAEEVIGGLPDAEEGRYSLDACIPYEAHCDGCGCKDKTT